ncbi:MAG: hypothetical protein WC178_04210 [Candidatus Paceibacterota bacterium]
MIDSIVWRLENNQFVVSDEVAFDGESSMGIRGKFHTASSFVKTYAEGKKKKGVYFPYIEIKKDKRGGKIIALEIQVSLPRLDFGSSLFEVDESRLESIYTKTIKCLREVDIIVLREELEKATIKKADFCKNITLPSYFGTAQQVIRKLGEFDYKQSSSFKLWENRERMHNREGIKINFYNTSQGYTIYDKILEIQNKGYTTVEKKMKETIEAGEMKNNVIRFELSFYKQATLESSVGKYMKIGNRHLTLRDILSNDMAKNILLEAFDKVYQPNFIFTLALAEMKENELEDFLASKNLSVWDQAFIQFWVNKAIKIGIQQALEELKRKTSSSSYDRDKRKIKSILEEFNKNEPIIGYIPSITGYLREEHKKFVIENLANPCTNFGHLVKHC